MRNIPVLATFLGLFLAATSLFAAVPYDLELGRYNALIISNQNYKQLSPLKTPHGDADALATLLRSDYGFKVTMLRDTNRAGTLDALDQLVEKLTPNDNLLIFYAGHGHLDSATGEGYWLPVTASPKRRSEWISNSDITDTLRATVAKHVLVISDSCFSGTLSRSAAAGLNVGSDKRDYYKKLATRTSRTALSSGGLEPVDDGGTSGHSVFAGALISALRRNNEPILEAESLYTQIKRPVALNSSAIQKPQYSDVRATGHDEGDFLFAKRNIRKVEKPIVATTASTTASTSINTQAAYELAFWDSIKDSQDPGDFRAYLENYSQGKFVALANLRIKKLSKSAQTNKNTLEPEKADSDSGIVNEAKVIPRVASVKNLQPESSRKDVQQGENVLVVLATPDSEYSPKYKTIEAYSNAIADLVTSSFKGQSLLYLPRQNIAQGVVNEDDSHLVSKQLCQRHQARSVISIELDLSRDIEELSRTPDDLYLGFFDCKNNNYKITRYNLDFKLNEEFAYAAGIRSSLERFSKKYRLADK